jgi:hypothetical protein
MIDKPPAAFAFWPEYAKCIYSERVAFLREGNNLPDNQPMPWPMHKVAIDAAEREIEAVKVRETKGTFTK